ncbi:carboxylase:pyruvate/acetyl-coa/propionyl-CoA [Coprinopsis marcescibilis]|uniref:Carboxylase:pyruvate/acetyl-coa/propionyl-CoA n=1 Tax=Coprinopsis marcescibilis TaxID=230819 RepID=A0A5C3L797_COPMA|nr:carboxylase:pyruvate/acetyl-coa/propionyl-CoA [Coprinopsis marcescibilis]
MVKMPKVLVANRGEIAIRILRSAAELGWGTVAIYTETDPSHASYADEAVKLDGPEDFLKIDVVARAASDTNCTHVHPGYGFLSESPSLADALAALDPPRIFIGPSRDTLCLAGDKMLSRELVISLGIAVAPGRRVSTAEDVKLFGAEAGYPIMIKALDGGGGRGIRAVNLVEEVGESFKRCLGESPSRQVFVEKALTGPGWKHIEVQIIGDGSGEVNHFWERECSVQRRFQKVVEVAPSRLSREMVAPLLEASLKIARHLKYHGLGTFEYLMDSKTGNWVFLEINPRVQVEHTITEEIVDIDLVRAQLQLFAFKSLRALALNNPVPPPQSSAVQLRLTAEDPARSFQSSPGTIQALDIAWPAGRGVRVDTWLSSGPAFSIPEWNIGTDFDSLLAKVIVRGSTFEEMTQKARRALAEFTFNGAVQTNASLLAGVIDHPDWVTGNIDTLWLERNASNILQRGTKLLKPGKPPSRANKPVISSGNSGTTAFLQPGALFHLNLSPLGTSGAATKHTLTLSSIGQNTFPDALSGTLQSSLTATPFEFSLIQSTSAAVSTGSFELADPNNVAHVSTPLTGKIVELHPALIAVLKGEAGGRVKRGETVMVLSVMKMENSIVSGVDGEVERVGRGIKPGVVVGEGILVCVIGKQKAGSSRL